MFSLQALLIFLIRLLWFFQPNITHQEQISCRPNGSHEHLLTWAAPTSLRGLRRSRDTNPGSSQRTTPEICTLVSPLESPAATDVWPVGGPSLVIIRPTLYLGAKTSFNSRQRTIREKRKKKWSAAKPSWKSQNSIPGSVLPAEQEVWRAPSCLHLFLFPSSPAVVVGEQCWSRCCRRLPPATGAVSAKINARSVTVLCCNALDSSFLALPLAALLPTCFLSPPLTCAQSHMRRHCWSLNTNRLSSLKDVIVPLRLDPPPPPRF